MRHITSVAHLENADPCSDGIEDGSPAPVGYQHILELGIPVEEGQFTIKDLTQADAAFFCGTAAEVIGWESIDGKAFAKPWASSLSSRIQKAYKDTVTEKQLETA